jgi:hypothetical protein
LPNGFLLAPIRDEGDVAVLNDNQVGDPDGGNELALVFFSDPMTAAMKALGIPCDRRERHPSLDIRRVVSTMPLKAV